MIVYGLNPVLEALRAGRAIRVQIAGRGGPRAAEILRLARAQGVPVEQTDRGALASAADGGLHQGIVAEVTAAADYDVADLVAGAAAAPLIVVLDGIEDPHNLGAILRTADAAGADGVVRQARHAAPLSAVVGKTSAGALAHVRIATVVNLARAIEELKQAGVWVVGLAGEAGSPYDEIDFRQPTAVVLGAEGTGLRRLVRDRCDLTAAIPMRGHVASLNGSVAAGIVLFEAVRQRRGRGGR